MITIAQIGSGYWGPNVANSFKNTGRANLRWICDPSPQAREIYLSRHPETLQTDNLDDVLNDQDVDAVAIVTPTNTHFDISKAALNAGKHVFVEKPLTTEIDEARELADLADAKNLTLMVGHVFQYNASIIRLKELIEAGELGDINYLNLERTNLGPVRTDVNALWDLVSHDAYIMIDLLGEAPAMVSAIGRAYLNQEIEDVIFATFSFDSGIVAHVHASWLNPRKVRQITAVGTKKMAVWDDLNLQEPIRLYDKRVEQPPLNSLEGTFMEYKTLVVDGGSSVPRIRLNEPLQVECAHFVECVENQTRPRSDAHMGLDVVRALTAAAESIRNQGAQTPIN